jgi:hypothetical protein
METTFNPPETAAAWQQIAPVLETAMDGLGERDRQAVLLRFFENKNLAEVGAALGMSEDGARLRVNRALDKLRAKLGKTGVTLTATVIAAAVTANAVTAAPVGLAATISAAAATLAGTTAAALIMTTLQKIAVTAALTVTIGGGIYAAKQAHDARAEVQTLQAQQAPMAEQLQQITAQHDKDTNMIAWLKGELVKNGKNNSELLKLRGQVGVQQNQNSDLAQLRDENLKLQLKVADLMGWWKNYTNAPPIKNPFWNRDNWKESGTLEPLAALNTFLAAMKNGDQNRLTEVIDGTGSGGYGDNLLRLPKSYWDKVTGVQVVDISMLKDSSNQNKAMIGTIIDSQRKSADGSVRFDDPTLETIDKTWQSSKRWMLVETNGEWLVSGFY